ncbi:MAG TPA: efflux RND transporter periplasmic adaptor subunit [Erysipelotrichaceae bacterium]|nr:efflux RND transporter periplasmic adaptor subunit [Erysipelotrichaceae bacterium]
MTNKKIKNIYKILIGTMVVLVGLFYFTNQSTNRVVQAENLSTTTLVKRTLENTVSASGNIASEQVINLSSSTNTVVTKLNVQVGDLVKKGDILAQFDTKELNKDITVAQYSYDNAKTLYDMKVETAYEKLDSEKRRYAGAYSEGSAEWQYVYDDAINWDAKVQAAQAEYDNVRLNDTTTNTKTQLDDLKQKRMDASLISPIDGIVTNINGSVGNISNGVVIVVQDINAIVVKASIPGYDVIKLTKGLDVTVNLNDVDGDYNGKISVVSPITNTNGDYDLSVKLDGDTSNLRFGMEATIRVVIDRKDDVFVVSQDAIVEKEGKFYVVAYDSTKEFDKQKNEIEVELGMETDFYVEIKSNDLSEGLEILNDPLNKYVEVETSNINPGPFGGAE